MKRLYSTNNITNLLKQLPKTTGNGPFASAVKFTSLNSNNHDISTRSTTLITLPANSQVHYSGNIVAIKDCNKCEIDQDTIIAENSPLNVIISTSQLACTNSITIKGMNNRYNNHNDDVHKNNDDHNNNNNNWNIFNNTNIIGYKQHSSGQLQITLGYDDSIRLNKQDNVFFDKSAIVAIMGDPRNYHSVTPRLHRSLVIYNICKFMRFYWNSFKKLSMNERIYKYINENGLIPINKRRKEMTNFMRVSIPNSVIDKYDNLIKPIFENLITYFGDLFRLEKPSLVKITGPAIILLKK